MAAIRGAVCCNNTAADISDKAVELIRGILTANGLSATDVDAVFFSATNDLDACYPAAAVRERLNMSNVAFMCLQEMNVVGSLRRCLRVCVFTQKISQNSCVHRYLGAAKSLRSDLAE